jgi:hypothetical protein
MLAKHSPLLGRPMASELPLVGQITIGIKLRGSDKQSSIWHHKEKQ